MRLHRVALSRTLLLACSSRCSALASTGQLPLQPSLSARLHGAPSMPSALLMVDTTDALAVLTAQLDDMLHRSSTHTAFSLASPGNRRATANGGYDHKAFDAMVRSPSYAPLLAAGGRYQVLSHRQAQDSFMASVRITHAAGSSSYSFVMSLQPPSVVDEHPSLEPYQLRPGHPPVWRTDSVMLSRS